MKFRITHLFVATALIAATLAALFQWPDSNVRSVRGFTLSRDQSDSIRISWDTPGGFNISPLSMRLGLGSNPYQRLPDLSHLQGVWMWDLHANRLGRTEPASMVNPRNRNAIDQMVEMIELGEDEIDNEKMTRIAAANYIYLGFVVLDIDDVYSLKAALNDRTMGSTNGGLQTPQGLLYRLNPGVEQLLADDPSDPYELEAIRSLIPVLFERVDRRNGHPSDSMHVLYLDGHREEIKIGNRFPATQEFIDAFNVPAVGCSRSGSRRFALVFGHF